MPSRDDDRDDDRPRRRREDDDDYDPRPRAEAPAKSNAGGLAMSIVALVLGTCALLFSFIPCLGYLAIYPGAVAIILSVIGLFMSVRSKALPITAVVVSVLSVGIAYWQGERIKEAAREGERILKEEQERREREKNKQGQNPNL
jgi:hypothetical protein